MPKEARAGDPEEGRAIEEKDDEAFKEEAHGVRLQLQSC